MMPGDHTSGATRPSALSPDFRLLFDSAPGRYLVLSKDLTIVAATDSYLRLTRTERRSVIGRTIPSVFPENSATPGGSGLRTLAASLRRVLHSRAADTMALQKIDVPRTDSLGGGVEERFWSVVNTPILDPDGTVLWIIHCIEDVTELVRQKLASCERELAAKQLREANGELARLYEKTRELDSLKTSFLANVGDEFRMALPLILETAERARQRENGTVHGNALLAVHLHSRRLLKRVNALLDFARVEGGRIELVLEPTNLSQLTEEIVEPFRSIIENDGLELIIDCPPLPEEIYVDRSVWEKIVVTLIFNAFRFTFEGSIAVSIEYRPEQVVVLIRDTGTGIPENELPRIFERFHQPRGARSRKYERAGIGLPLVRELIQQHGGSIDVWSEERRGTTFQISLPTGWRPTETLLWEDASQVERHVLIVHDDPVTRSDLSRLLSLHFRVTVAENGDVALGAIRTERPDLIVSNVVMPVLDGLGLVQYLKVDPLTAAIPVILLSDVDGKDAAAAAIDTGADDYLVRSLSDEEILVRVRTHLKLAQLQRATAAAARELAEWRVELLKRAESQDEESDSLSSSLDQTLHTSLPHVGGLIDILERDFAVSLDARGRRYLSGIASAAREMEALIGDLSNFSRVSQMEVTKTSINLRSLVQEVLDRFGQPLSGPPTQWILGDLPCIYGNADMLRLVLVNLVSNALKFSSVRPERRIEISGAEARDGNAVFFVRDNGVGFSMDHVDRLFGVFQRQHPREEFEGAGIGLAIVKQIIQKHGGRTWATGTVGEGATFYCSLPTATGTE